MPESDALHAGLIEPMSHPPLNQVLGEVEFGRQTKGESKHVSFAFSHARALKETAKQHGIRLTWKLVSCVRV